MTVGGRRLADGVFCLAAALAGRSHVPLGSPAFQDGYVAGCYDGFFDADGPTTQTRWVRDDARFDSDADYKSGWQEGYVACFEEETRPWASSHDDACQQIIDNCRLIAYTSP